MAIIKCPECEASVSDTARACPHCGYAVAEHARAASSQVEGQRKTCAGGTVAQTPARGRAYPWIAAVVGLFAGRVIGQVTGFYAAQMIGVQDPGATPYVSALVHGQDAGSPAAFFGAVAGFIAALSLRAPRGWGLIVSPLVGLLAGALVGAAAGFVFAYFRWA